MLFLALVPSIILRIRIEEKMLSTVEGYAEYAMKHSRLVRESGSRRILRRSALLAQHLVGDAHVVLLHHPFHPGVPAHKPFLHPQAAFDVIPDPVERSVLRSFFPFTVTVV